jgi:hypothetical protein
MFIFDKRRTCGSTTLFETATSCKDYGWEKSSEMVLKNAQFKVGQWAHF